MQAQINETMLLTEDHDYCRFGMATLYIDGKTYGPEDRVPNGVTAAELVKLWGEGVGRSRKERNLAGRFCIRNESGPQVDGATANPPATYISVYAPVSVIEKALIIGEGAVAPGFVKAVREYIER